MTSFDTGEKPGAWFDMKGGGRVQLKTLSPAQYRKIIKATEKKEPIFHEVKTEVGGKTVMVDTLFERVMVDEDFRRQMINDAVIPTWEKLFDKSGAPIPCTTENREALMLMDDPTFRDFVNEKMTVLNESEAKQVEDLQKN